jgi:3-polyprenyl-4-hydroxybenzoate decarboxylase
MFLKMLFKFVVAKIMECARHMVMAHKNLRVLPIQVDLVVTRASEDESDEDDGSDDESHESDEAERSEVVNVEQEKNCAICFESFNSNVGVPIPCHVCTCFM